MKAPRVIECRHHPGTRELLKLTDLGEIGDIQKHNPFNERVPQDDQQWLEATGTYDPIKGERR
jgi:hypothetical protein